MNEDVMYMVVDAIPYWVYTVEADLNRAIDIARQMNDEENPKYHHYVVIECSGDHARAWLEAWKKVNEV